MPIPVHGHLHAHLHIHAEDNQCCAGSCLCCIGGAAQLTVTVNKTSSKGGEAGAEDVELPAREPMVYAKVDGRDGWMPESEWKRRTPGQTGVFRGRTTRRHAQELKEQMRRDAVSRVYNHYLTADEGWQRFALALAETESIDLWFRSAGARPMTLEDMQNLDEHIEQYKRSSFILSVVARYANVFQMEVPSLEELTIDIPVEEQVMEVALEAFSKMEKKDQEAFQNTVADLEAMLALRDFEEVEDPQEDHPNKLDMDKTERFKNLASKVGEVGGAVLSGVLKGLLEGEDEE